MDFLQTEQRLAMTSKTYESIYMYFNEQYGIEYAELFVLCSIIGFKEGKRMKFTENGREFRTNYIKTNNRAALYSILLCNSDIQYKIEDFANKEIHKNMVNLLEEYAEGGMTHLVDRVFRSKYYRGNLDSSYKYHLRDLMKFIEQKID
jgi:hypothetical protein